jgi:hypothetical protein
MFFAFGEPGAIIAIAIHMLPYALTTLYFNAKKGLNNYWLEFLVLGFWPIGWVVGVLVEKLVALAAGASHLA